jgi:hypothetical protein
VTDGTTSSDCATGGASTQVAFCIYNGSSWAYSNSGFVSLAGPNSFGTGGTLNLLNSTATNPFQLPSGSPSNLPLTFGGNVSFGLYGNSSTVICFGKGSANANAFCLNSAGNFKTLSAGMFSFVGSATDASASVDSSVCRQGAGVIEIGSGTGCGTTGKLQASGYISVGTKFTTNAGCSEVTTVGGGTAGKITTVGSTSCTTIVTLGDTATAPNGWMCNVHDITTSADYYNPHITSTATTATIVTGTIVAGDVLEFGCSTGY